MPPKTSETTRVFLDIVIGDQEEHASLVKSYMRTIEFINTDGKSYGLPEVKSVEDLDEEQKEMVKELYESNPSVSSQGPIQLSKPSDLPGGRLVLELFNKDCPKTCENFRCLCTGERGVSKSTKKPLHYEGSKFFRVVPEFIAQGGDFTRGDGSGGDSIYNSKFSDEPAGLKKKFDKKGLLGMANSGKNSNTSQFFLTLTDDAKKLAKMNGKHVLFGQVVQGLEILDAINKVECKSDTPSTDIMIVSCGQVA
ncbi:hypothetical protein K493DRAFT_252943 [Basidiobolus meristosporus CBS 931.73]|uniref:Peptidyl-prolyl cis-trans isomerase n=1 Tax=Basidiobolus meristosporus CBS 931.73 TaxID=1314790 RepID=A0A1Y1Z4D2_9FUNG|nr:hypothetical protein K493DRAFT_252943 [Basidiobolus meristosporus CBS 931.73]|eukprot:ORY05099.1 hypothetical protein K493DRAFT_252943 [Basidiobolus meristosporus CBS 931.73]